MSPFPQQAPNQMFPNQYSAPYPSYQAGPQPNANGMLKVQLGNALRYVSNEILGFPARNVPVSVFSEIPHHLIERRNPDGSVTIPLGFLVNGLEAVYRSAFNHADLSAYVTIPPDVLPYQGMPQYPQYPQYQQYPQNPPSGPMGAPNQSMYADSIRSSFEEFARVNAQAPGGGAYPGWPGGQAGAPNPGFPSGQAGPAPDSAEASADLRAIQDLSKRLSGDDSSESNEHSDEDESFIITGDSDGTEKAESSENQDQTGPADVGAEDYNDWKQVELKAVFGLDKTLDQKGVFDLINRLGDVRSAAYIVGEETRLSTNGFDGAAVLLSGLIQNVRKLGSEMGGEGAQSFALQTERGAVVFFTEGEHTIAVMARGAELSHASKQRIILILRELIKG